MKYEKTEINPFLTQYKLEGEEDKFSRLSMYNKLLFLNLSFLVSKKPKTIIIINENNTGGLIVANEKFIDKTIEIFAKKNWKYKFNFVKQHVSKGLPNKMVYCSFKMELKGNE